MKFVTKTLLSSTVVALISGCSGKNFTMQDYADKWFNDKSVKESNIAEADKKEEVVNKIEHDIPKKTPKTEVKEIVQEKSSSYIDDKETNKAIKVGPGADIAWSSTYKQDEKMKGQGSMQKSLDEWTKENWIPATEGDKEQTEKDKEANEHFTIQHYVDKIDKYLDNKEKDSNKSSHYETLNKMPVIGK